MGGLFERDRLSARQIQSHRFITERLQVQVELFQVRIWKLGAV